MIAELTQHFGYAFEPSLIEEIARVGTLRSIPAGTEMIDIGQTIKGVPLMLSGAIKISREDANGDELLLYYLEEGDSCSLTFSVDFNERKSKIRAVAELPSTLVMLPLANTKQWAEDFPSWRNFIIKSYQNRLDELLDTLDSIAFDQLEKRLWDYLLEKKRITEQNNLPITHHSIALDLHSSRVVVSRLLKRMENEQKIKLHRQAIEILPQM